MRRPEEWRGGMKNGISKPRWLCRNPWRLEEVVHPHPPRCSNCRWQFAGDLSPTVGRGGVTCGDKPSTHLARSCEEVTAALLAARFRQVRVFRLSSTFRISTSLPLGRSRRCCNAIPIIEDWPAFRVHRLSMDAARRRSSAGRRINFANRPFRHRARWRAHQHFALHLRRNRAPGA